jgi:Site-specific recombinase XerD
MSEKRRDNKGRILNTGESQRKDGRYAYKYVDTFGKPQFVYSWKLVATDKTPTGKRKDISLRDKVKEVKKDLDDGIDTIGKKMTVCQLYAKQISHRGNVKRGTKTGRKYLMDILQKDKLGAKSIDSVKLSDAKEWAIRMNELGYAYKTINNYKRSLKASFYTAIQDDCVRKNPFDFALNTVLADNSKPKVALTKEQEEKLLAFVLADTVYQKYCDEILVLLRTGLRISEFCGLTPADLDFENRLINVDHQLLKDSEIGYYIETPKTQSGIRQIPMCEEAYQALQRIVDRRKQAKVFQVDGYSNFLFLTNKGNPKVGVNYTTMLIGLVKKYNKNNEDVLPNITPHVFRHTFCTNFAIAGMNPKALQYIMGHSNVSMTLDYYSHATATSAKAEMDRLVA